MIDAVAATSRKRTRELPLLQDVKRQKDEVVSMDADVMVTLPSGSPSMALVQKQQQQLKPLISKWSVPLRSFDNMYSY